MGRKLKKHLMEGHFSNKEYDEISLIFSDIIQQCKSMQVQYDKETNHGLKKYAQKDWSINIQKSLKELEDYQHVKVACKFID